MTNDSFWPGRVKLGYLLGYAHPEWRWSVVAGRSNGTFGSGPNIWVSLLIPFALIAVPTGLLWHLDRRRPPGSCPKCGYDLAGLAAGAPCPECGKARA